jgi:N utilization substance protein A
MNSAPRTEFSQALKAIAAERGLDPNIILDTIKQAIVAAYRRDAKERSEEIPEEVEIDAKIDSVNGETKVFIEGKDVTPPGFGRIAAQTAKQVIHQKIREAEKGAIMEEFSERVGSLVSGLILRFDGPNVRVDLGRTEAIMEAGERIPTERLSLNQRLTFLLKEIKETPRGKDIFLSRADPEFIKKLFAREVPEISSGSVEIKEIAREPGVRTKIAVKSDQNGVDPVGSCVGQKGVRVQAVTNEVGGERVDVIAWSEDPAELIKSALAPADGLSVKLGKKEKIAKVMAPEDQLSLAIGKDGQNVRLTAKLTGFRIEVESTGKLLNPIEEKKEEEKKEEKVEEKAEEPKEGVKAEEVAVEKPTAEPAEKEGVKTEEPAAEAVEEKVEKTEVVAEDVQSEEKVEELVVTEEPMVKEEKSEDK